jgi:hypothetical protein
MEKRKVREREIMTERRMKVGKKAGREGRKEGRKEGEEEKT